MKMFIVFLFFACALVTIISGIIGDTDLTPDTPPASGEASQSEAQALPAPDQPGQCPSSYTVQSGDTMSEIAKACGLTLSDLSAANPQIADPDLIYAGQTIQIPGAPVQVVEAFTATPVPQLYAIPPTTQPVVAPSATQAPVEAAAPAAPTTDPILSAFDTASALEDSSQPVQETPAPVTASTGMAVSPGSLVEVTITGLPPNTPVTIGIGEVGSEPFPVDERITDDQGEVIVLVSVPANAQPNEQWTVTATTMDEPVVEVTAVPFVIGRLNRKPFPWNILASSICR